MSRDYGDMKTEELIERFDRGESLIEEGEELQLMENISGPMDTTSVRFPKALLHALDLASGDASDRSSIMRVAVFEWLRENNPDALIEANQQINRRGQEEPQTTTRQGVYEKGNEGEMERNIYEGIGVTEEAEKDLRSRGADLHREIRLLRESLENGKVA